jgi:hypothetical protein
MSAGALFVFGAAFVRVFVIASILLEKSNRPIGPAATAAAAAPTRRRRLKSGVAPGMVIFLVPE